MSPPKKRVKRAAAAAAAAAVVESSMSSDPTLENVERLFSNMIAKIKNVDTARSQDEGNDLLLSLMKLKAWQHDLLEKLDNSEKELSQAYTRKERQQRALAALHYEKEQLDKELLQCRNFELKYLKQLAREEVGPIDMDADTEDQSSLFSTFLQANVHDPKDKQKIIAKLHQELTARGSLERDLKINESQLERIKKELKINESFLNSLPGHLSVIERATMSLQKFMSHKTPQGTLAVAKMITTDRRHRLDLARSLPGPLYTLFVQFQHYLDRPTKLEHTIESGVSITDSISLSIASEESIATEVILHIPIPTITNSSSTPERTKRVSVHFRYYQEHNIITALASGAKTALNQEILLDELFPNDYPDIIPGTDGRPYHWCNYLGGLHTVSKEKVEAESVSLRVVLLALERRIRANETLKHILHQLERNHVPQTSRKDLPCTLIKFAPKAEADNNARPLEKTYSVVFVPGKSEIQYSASVRIHMARYPAVPPLWFLNEGSLVDPEKDAKEGAPLYDSSLALLERFVNTDGLNELLNESLPHGGNDESRYEWILLQQLRCICERVGKNSKEYDKGPRQFKGRDHAPIV